jgi:uncharacterized membrane protein
MLVWIATDSTPTPPSASEETAVAPPGRGPRGAGRDQTQVAASTTASPSWQCGECALRAAEARVWCPSVTYEQTISDVVKVVEAVGAGIMVFGGLGAFVAFTLRARRADTLQESYPALRRDLGRCILLGLEVLIVADIVRTIIVDPTLESVAVLGSIVVIRILLSFSLEVEIDGVWPWHRRQFDSGAAGREDDA